MRRINLLTTFLAFTIMAGVAHAGEQKPREEQRFAFEMRGLGWKQVLEWLSDQSGLPVASKNPPPPGTFTFISPTKGKTPKTYTLPEVIDLMNDSLSMQGYLLVRRKASITIVAADEIIDPGLAPHIELTELKSRGRTELVSIALPLERIGKADVPEIRKLMGRLGDVVVLPESKRIILRDTVENLQRILAITAKENPRPKADPMPELKPIENNTKAAELKYVRLVAISKSKTGHEAMLRDLGHDRTLSLRVSPGFTDFQITDFKDPQKIVLSAHVIRIDAREMFFVVDNQAYRLRAGDNLAVALAKPLSLDEEKEVGIERASAK